MLLREYVKQKHIKAKEFAEEIGTSYQYLLFMVSGTKCPGKKMAKKIESATCGKVSRLEALYAEDFMEENNSDKIVKLED